MKLINDHYVDSNNNKWNTSLYSEAQAKKPRNL